MKISIIVATMVLVTLTIGQSMKLGDCRLSPRLLNYQGYLTDTLGDPVTNPSVSMAFAIFDAPSAGSQKWSETQGAVAVDKGIFNVLLGSVTPIPDSVFTAGISRYLQLTVAGQVLSPRTQIVSAPYAYTSTYSDTASYARNAVPDNDWTINGNVMYPGADRGLSMRNSNIMYGTNDSTHICFGVSCTTGYSGGVVKYATVAGGYGNHANQAFATVAGGENNIAGGSNDFVGGGMFNTAYGAFTAVCGGRVNYAIGANSFIGGGDSNYVSTPYSTISGGKKNSVLVASYGAISGGYSNIVDGFYATICGGNRNRANGQSAAIAGGYLNYAYGQCASVGGGESDTATGTHATIGGGMLNRSTNLYTTVGGGYGNNANGQYASITGGYNNSAGEYGVIGGGNANSAAGNSSVISGGRLNYINANYAAIGGGYSDTANGSYSVVPGGSANRSAGNYSFAAGRRAKANHDGTFVWADSTDANFISTGVNQFLIRSTGGVGIGDASPTGALHVKAASGQNELVIERAAGAENTTINFLNENSNERARILFGGSAEELSFWTGGTPPYERMRISYGGNVGIGVTSPTSLMDIESISGYNQLRIRRTYTPTGSSDPNGNTGDIAWDNTYVYIKTSVGWKRATLASW